MLLMMLMFNSEEALHDSSSGLTYIALSGVRKELVEDVERLFGDLLIK